MPTLEELVDENDRLSLQVKRLIRAESRLYSFQEELEKQRTLFKKLSVTAARGLGKAMRQCRFTTMPRAPLKP